MNTFLLFLQAQVIHRKIRKFSGSAEAGAETELQVPPCAGSNLPHYGTTALFSQNENQKNYNS